MGQDMGSQYSDVLWTEVSGDRIPVGRDFPQPSTPASYTMGTESFPELKGLRRGINYPLPSSAQVKQRTELYHYSASAPSWQVTQ